MTGIPLTRMSDRRQHAADARWKTSCTRRSSARTKRSRRSPRPSAAAAAGLKDPKRPTGCFIFAGPTGVGKTLLAKALAEFMFGDEDALIQIDMSEYMEKHNVSRLDRRPAGLRRLRRRRPAHREDSPPAVRRGAARRNREGPSRTCSTCCCRVMEEGRLTDSFGRNVDFRNTILIMTTNAGAEAIKNERPFGFHAQGRRDAATRA